MAEKKQISIKMRTARKGEQKQVLALLRKFYYNYDGIVTLTAPERLQLGRLVKLAEKAVFGDKA